MSPFVPTAEQTQGCVRCGATVPLGTAMCERCNPLGLKEPAPSQVHGTVLLAVVVSIVGLALLGRFALSGIGPFEGKIGNIISAPPGLAVTLTVTNHGSAAGSTTCRVFDPASSGIGPDSALILSPRIDPGRTVSFSMEVTTIGSTIRPLAVECTAP
jgi:ribosomal protein L40E